MAFGVTLAPIVTSPVETKFTVPLLLIVATPELLEIYSTFISDISVSLTAELLLLLFKKISGFV